MTVHAHMASFYFSLYEKGKLNFIITCEVPKIILTELYNILLKTKEISPIELLIPEEKEKLRSECMGTGLKFTNREMNNACRILFTLKSITK